MNKAVGINLLTFDTPALTGVGYFFKRLFEALPPLPNVEFVFFCQRDFPLHDVIQIPAGIRIRLQRVPRFRSKFARVAYEQCILPFLAAHVDVLYSPCVANPLWTFSVPRVTTIYDLTPFVVPDKYGKLQGSYVKWITRLLARCSERVITTSEHSRTDLMRFLGVPESRLDVVYAFVPPRDTSHVRYDPFFLTVGTRQPAKNLPGVIRAFSIFSRQFDDGAHRLVVVGGVGRGGDESAELAAQLGIQDRVHFAGYVDEDELNRLYETCKGHITLSFYEGFGIPVLEALSWHKPSVASDISSLPEVLGNTGIRVNPRDVESAARAIKDLADDPQRFLSGLEEQLEKFSARTQVERFLQVLGVGSPGVS